MPSPPRELVAAYQRSLARVEARSEAAIVAAWSAGADLSVLVGLALAAQRAMVSVTDAGLALAAGITTGTDTSPLGIDPEPLIGVRARHGVPLEEVYSRPAKVVRESGFDRGLAYLRGVVAMDARLAHRNAAHAVAMADRRVEAYRRVTSGTAPCGLCVVASARVYRRGDLLPLHEHCRCSVVPVYTPQPGRSGDWVDRRALQDVYEQAGSTSARDLSHVRFDLSSDTPVAFPAEVQEQLRALHVRVVLDPEIGPRLDGDRHDVKVPIG